MSVVMGIPLVKIPVMSVIMAGTPSPGLIFAEVERQACSALDAETVRLVETYVHCWRDAGEHLESECAHPESIHTRVYTYQSNAELAAVPDPQVAPAETERMIPPGQLATKTKDPRFPGHGKGVPEP